MSDESPVVHGINFLNFNGKEHLHVPIQVQFPECFDRLGDSSFHAKTNAVSYNVSRWIFAATSTLFFQARLFESH